MSIEKHIEMAEKLCDLFEADGETEITPADLLDNLATLGLRLSKDTTGVSSQSYMFVLNEALAT